MNVKTPELFKLLFQTLHPTLELLSEYSFASEPIHVRCKVCGKEWFPRANTVKKLKCTLCEKSNKYLQLIKEINPNITILSPKVLSNTKEHVICRCKICGYVWNTATLSHLKLGHGCPKCAKNASLTIEEIQNRINTKFNNLKVLKIDGVKNVKVLCLLCGNIREISLGNIMKNGECEYCENKRYTLESFEEAVKKVNPNFEIIGKFKNVDEKIQIKCKKCGLIKKELGHHLLERSVGCNCREGSIGESIVKQILDENNIKYVREHIIRSNIFTQSLVRIDFYLPDYNVFIEYNGIQHYTESKFFGGKLNFEKLQLRDSQLRQYCLENKIKLVEIPYNYDIEEIEKEILDNLN